MIENEISMACPRCGAVVDIDLVRCPKCGLDFYPEDLKSEFIGPIPSQFNALNLAGAILLGVFLSVMVAFIIHFLVAQFFPGTVNNGFASFILFMAGPLGALLGGYVSGQISRWKPFVAALIVSILTVPVVVLLNSRWSAVLMTPISVINWILIIMSGPLALFLPGWLNRGIKWANWNTGAEKRLYEDLLVRARFDRDRADRLIAYEQRRFPNGNRVDWIKSAIERWERDNR